MPTFRVRQITKCGCFPIRTILNRRHAGCLCLRNLRYKAESSPQIISVIVDVGVKPQKDMGGI